MQLDPDPKPGSEAHDHAHVTAITTAPTLQADHGNSTDEFSKGPYVLDEAANAMTYSDTPNTARYLMPGAQKLLTKNYFSKGIRYEICNIRIVQRFVTTAYISGKAVQSYHWTSTSEIEWGGKTGSNPVVAILGKSTANVSPEDIIKQWWVATQD